MGRHRKHPKKEPVRPDLSTSVLVEPESEAADVEEQSEEVLEFIRAIDEYRRTKNRPFPTWTEVLGILRSLGYRKGRD